ncbi:substrate-binding domain-containing protein [Streptomyces sp. NPDC008061]|jgi:DNA-binding LacI/PurR family transcriptional regulator|uniref:substrate-binding domain-containing protein n=1 Tax=Streptomyces sp. NPDC008061 TaxID=3364805 RepID=UPI0036E2BC34
MHAEERYKAILRQVRRQGSVRVSELASELGASPATVRKDVEVLSERGLVVRVHGGAMLPEDWSQTMPSEPVAAPDAASPGRRLTFGLVVPAANYYYPELIKGVQEAAEARGIRVALRISEYNAEQERVQAAELVEDGADGLLLAPTGADPDAPRQWYEELGVPVVLVERGQAQEGASIDFVVTDHVFGARRAVEHLLEVGRRRIGLLVRGASPTVPWLREGYAAGMRQAGVDVPEDASFIDLGFEWQGNPAYDRPMDSFLEAVEAGRLDAAIVHPDTEAVVLLQRLRSRSISVPSDLAIVSYDDEVAGIADIPLSAVAPAKYDVGVSAVEMLRLRLAEPSRSRRRTFILPQLHVRFSSDL